MNIDSLKQGERELVITEACAITVERYARGAYATVTDAGSAVDGMEAFGTEPSTALWILQSKLAAMQAQAVCV